MIAFDLLATAVAGATPELAALLEPTSGTEPGALALPRRATALSGLVAEAAGKALRAHGLDPAGVAIVVGSVYGELGIAAELLASFQEGEGLPSPTRFHNSVHNAAAAYLSIATRNAGFSTAISAGEDTAAMTLLEAASVSACLHGPVLAIVADEPAPGVFQPARTWPALALAALVQHAGPGAPDGLGRVRLRAGAGPAAPLPLPLLPHPCAGLAALAWCAARRRAGPIALSPGYHAELEAALP